MTPRLKSLLVLIASCGMAQGAGADPPPPPGRSVGWRGDGSGLYPSAEPPTRWSAKENVLWKTEVGKGSSSPIVVGSRVLLTSEPDLLVCVDAASGKELWRKAHRLADLPPEWHAKRPGQTGDYGDATPTPVSDGKWVWAFLNTGIVACYDLEGTCRWMKWYNMRLATNYGRTASPVLVGGRLLVHFGPLACLDATTGKLLWTSDAARASYGTPAPARIGGVDVVITPKGHIVRVADGKILASDLGNCTYTSPVVEGRVVYFADTNIIAVRLPEQAGEQAECKELWCEDLPGDAFASPVICGGRIYTVDRAANYHVIDASTGKTILKKTLDLPPAGGQDAPNVYPSPCLAGKRLYLSNDAGETVLLALDDQAAVVGSCSLPGGSGATPAFSGKRMFVRGGKLLYCVGEQ